MYNRWVSSPYDLELYHHGIKGQRWGIRRFQQYPKGYTGDGKFIAVGRSLNNNDKTRRDKEYEKYLEDRANYMPVKDLSDEERKLKKKDPEAYDQKMLKEIDTRFLPNTTEQQRVAKASIEAGILGKWSDDNWDNLPERTQDQTIALFKYVRDHSYDGYNAEAHSQSQQAQQKEHDKAWNDFSINEQKVVSKYQPELERLYKKYELLGSNRAYKQYSELYDKMLTEIKPLEEERRKKVREVNRKAAIQALKDVGYEVNDRSISLMLNMIEYD